MLHVSIYTVFYTTRVHLRPSPPLPSRLLRDRLLHGGYTRVILVNVGFVMRLEELRKVSYRQSLKMERCE